MTGEPIAEGVIVILGERQRAHTAALAKESASILKAFQTTSSIATSVPPEADFALLLVDEAADLDALTLPPMKDRAGIVAGVGEDAALVRASIARARRKLRLAGATLGARELALSPEHFDPLGLASDGLREKLEILLRSLVNDAERLRLRREGWEEPTDRASD